MIKGTPKASGRLFAEPDSSSARLDGVYTANIDGAARGNPGPASYGVVLRRPDGTPLESFGKYIGRHTNNVAEYYALIAALDYAAAALDNTSGAKPAFASEQKSAQRPLQKNVADASNTASRASTSSPRKVRALYRDGVLVPAEPLGLKEGATVEISVALVPEQN